MSIPFYQRELSGCLAHLVSELGEREGVVLRVCGPQLRDDTSRARRIVPARENNTSLGMKPPLVWHNLPAWERLACSGLG